jgi:hypothetical protein
VSRSNETLDVCGVISGISSEWIFLGGPIKGSYVIKSNEDVVNDYISDFGMRVGDPCQIVDNSMKINLNPTNRTVKDLKYHDGTDSHFWLPSVC